ncbi:MAG: hypothetical protein EOO29_32530, partial [Comamonadaceae bacterium]
MSLFKAASTVSLLTLASRITGLLRDVLMTSVFGVSALTDAFHVAFRIPNLFRRVLGEGAFSQAFVPVLAAHRTEAGEPAAKALVDHVGTLLTWVLVLLCVMGVVGAPLLVWAMASGLKDKGSFDAAVVMTRWMFPYIGFMSLVALAGGILNTWKKFAVPAARYDAICVLISSEICATLTPSSAGSIRRMTLRVGASRQASRTARRLRPMRGSMPRRRSAG